MIYSLAMRERFRRSFCREGYNKKGIQVKEKIKVGFVGSAANVGVTTLLQAFARFIVKNSSLTPAVVEISDNHSGGYPYDKIGIDRRFGDREYTSYYKLLHDNGNIRGVMNIDDGINWCLCDPTEDDMKLARQDALRLINSVPSGITLCDMPADITLDDLEFLSVFDTIVFIIDPLPSKLLASFDKLEVMKAAEIAGISVIYLLNKYNTGVSKRDVDRYINVKEYLTIPFIDSSKMYQAEFNCKTIYDMNDECNDVFEGIFERISIRAQSIL